MNEEYKDLKITEVLDGYFMFKKLLCLNLIVKQEDGYTINVDEANILLEKQLLEMQQQLKDKDEKISKVIEYINKELNKISSHQYAVGTRRLNKVLEMLESNKED